ncbi:hypothetical protein CSC40_0176 [Klebsiella pneumoniae]|nr:hypothetical protein CSC00_0641 [Klebsiella pneumoniae]AWF04762.1 hypothetical protein CSC25_3884 [Klebsiella pneumoniae]AWZ76933.1 hypothetical protein CSB99_4085 [Klebsiella pneumoniae]RCH17680.1 hypothetical protein CSC40_0176 [Klebsiella pneumoniae]
MSGLTLFGTVPFFCFFSTTLNNITYDSHISLFSNWKSHSLNT